MAPNGVGSSLHTDLVQDALEQVLWSRNGTEGLVHHSDRGCQLGFKGDSYDNALAETINGLYKAELIHRRAP